MQSGFARTGKMFGYEHYDVIPDLICCGKGMGNGYPISGVLGSAEVMDLPDVGNMSSTHSANPLACAIGNAVLHEIEERGLIKESARKGELLVKELENMKKEFPERISYILGKGLIASVIFKDPKTDAPDGKLATKISEKCFKKACW